MQMELQNLSMTYPSGKQALHQINLALKAPQSDRAPGSLTAQENPH